MSDGIDIYDVTHEAEKAAREERYARIRHVESVEKDLRAEFRREVMELREEMGELFVQMHATIKAVSDACDAGDNALQRVMDARTADRV
jgi:predicted phage gp36 major capsid-like protein